MLRRHPVGVGKWSVMCVLVLGGVYLPGTTGPIVAAEPGGEWLAASATQTDATKSQSSPDKWTKPVPLSFALRYTLVSDYVFRGVNYSEYPGEGREKPNHQFTTSVEWDTSSFGALGLVVWFEWYAAQDKLTPSYNGHNQEIDYTLYWKYLIAVLATALETGWIAYTFPPLSGDAHTTYEWYLKLSSDAAELFGAQEAVLNSYLAYYQDLDLARNGSWWEAGVSHPFALADCGLAGTAVLKDITVTPSLVLGVHHRYFDKLGLIDHPMTRLANLNYGLDVSYDLSRALGWPEQYGKVTVGGFLNFSQALHRQLLDDELYGGTTVGFA